MEIVSAKEEDMDAYGKTTKGTVYTIHIKLKDITKLADEMIAIVSDTSWIKRLISVDQAAFTACAAPTIKRLVEDIFNKVENPISDEFGEYMISITAQKILIKQHNHSHVPLAEIIKDRVSGNAGFDFHTESQSELIAFGEAKFSQSINPHGIAFKQIAEFIELKKDAMELAILKSFVSKTAADNAVAGKRAFVAAFSINGANPTKIIANALTLDGINALLQFPEIYVIGIEIDKSAN